MKKYIVMALALVAMAGCAKEENFGTKNNDGAIQFASESIASRVSSDGSTWASGDQIGVFMTADDGASYLYENMCYEVSSAGSSTTSFTAQDGEMYYENEKDATFYAVYPYSSTFASSGLDFSVGLNGLTNDYLMLAKTDVPWADGANQDDAVGLDFYHSLSKVKIVVYLNDTFDSYDITSCKFLSVPAEVNYRLASDGTLSPTYVSSSDFDSMTFNPQEGGWGSIEFIMHPNEDADIRTAYNDAMLVFDTSLGDYQLAFNPELKAGYSYTFNVYLGQNYVTYDEHSIEPWSPVDVEDLDISVDFNLTGNGTEADPYRVYTVEDLENVANDLLAHYLLMNDLDLKGATWSPLGSIAFKFTGSFDGGGFTISNYNLDLANGSYQGLFTATDVGGEIKNLNVECDFIMSSAYNGYIYNSGSLVASNDGSTISGCTSKINSISVHNDFSSSYSMSYIGMVGVNSGTITDCYIPQYNLDIDVDCGISEIGAIAGSNREIINNCYNLSNITIASTSIESLGGIVGENYNKMYNCYNLGNISVTTAGVGTYVGGVAGSISSEAQYSVYVANCYNAGSIQGYQNVGGVAGYIYFNSSSNSYLRMYMYSCYNVGAVTSNNGSTDIGGFYGGASMSGATTSYDIDYCFISNDIAGYDSSKLLNSSISGWNTNSMQSSDLPTALNNGAKYFNSSVSNVAYAWEAGGGSGVTADDYAYAKFIPGTLAGSEND